VDNRSHCQRTQEQSIEAAGGKHALPTRLLDVGFVEGRPHVRLRNTGDFESGTRYVTLSHCWGRKPVISLLESNVAEFHTSIPFESLPRTFRDAIEVARCLGYQYLWIDSLCIIQKSTDDWHRESAIIGDIYSNAILNIAATASVNGDGGLFHYSKSLELNPCKIALKGKGQDEIEFICQYADFWEAMVEEAPLAQRAWVVQERTLSRRVLHFAEDQIHWECQSCRDSEFSPGLYYSKEDLDFLASRSSNSVDIYDNWDRTVTRYTQCHLTFESDKFVALAGLAQQTCQLLGVDQTEYLAGIWRATIPNGLLWRARPHVRRRKRVLERAPSRSWACMNGEVLMPGDVRDGYVWDNAERADYARYRKAYKDSASKTYCELTSADISYLGDPFGNIIEGSLFLKGPLCAIQSTGLKGTESILERSRGNLDCTTNPVSIMTSSIRWDDDEACLGGMNNQVYFLLIEVPFGWCKGLVLRPMKLGQGHYQRLGQIMARPSNLDKLLEISKNPIC
jgi:hypothetical protein